MWKDPIVEEVRAAGEELARECGYDFHLLCERIRERERQQPPGRVVDLSAQTREAVRRKKPIGEGMKS